MVMILQTHSSQPAHSTIDTEANSKNTSCFVVAYIRLG